MGMEGVEFHEVSFGHSREKPILDRFTLTVEAPAGETPSSSNQWKYVVTLAK